MDRKDKFVLSIILAVSFGLVGYLSIWSSDRAIAAGKAAAQTVIKAKDAEISKLLENNGTLISENEKIKDSNEKAQLTIKQMQDQVDALRREVDSLKSRIGISQDF